VTLGKLATRLGLSKTTVSRALAGYADVSPKTRERVRLAAEQYGYQPNPLAQRLRSGRLDTVGLIVPSDLRAFGDAFFVDLVTSLSSALATRGFDLLLNAAERGQAELVALKRLVEGKRVDGMIVVRTLRHDPRVSYLLDQKVPFVCHGRTEDARAYCFVDMDGEEGGRLATKRLIKLGHRRIAYIGPPSNELAYAWYRRRGYVAALETSGLRAEPSLILEGDGGEAFGETATMRLLKRRAPPTGLVCATDLEAIGALRAIEKLGLTAGRDLSVIGHDDLPEASATLPPLTTLRQPHVEIGARLAGMIAELIAGGSPATFQEIWQPELIVRESDGHCLSTMPAA
jgi:LacI family transcriptional regulator